MKIVPNGQRRAASGITLIECLVYMMVFTIVLGVVTAVFFQSWTDSKALSRNAADIVSALHVGDQWRADLRGATGALEVIETDGIQQLRIPASQGEVVYTFAGSQLRRQGSGDAIDRVWLDHVKSSRMEADPRGKVTAWRWELELQSSRKTAKFHPLFTFETVAGGVRAK